MDFLLFTPAEIFGDSRVYRKIAIIKHPSKVL